MDFKPWQKDGSVELGDVIHLRGCLEIELKDPLGNRVEYFKFDNTVVTAGRRWVLSRIHTNDAQTLSHIAVGTSTTAPTTGDTTLNSENTRKAIGTFTTTGLNNNPPSVRFEVQFATNEANTTLGEAGMFNSSAAGTLLSHVTFSTINKTTSNTLSISYTISN